MSGPELPLAIGTELHFKFLVKYDVFEPYYTLGEKLFCVHRKQGIDPTEPPRSQEYPCPPISNEPRMREIQEDMRAMGLRPFPCPLGLQLNEADRVESKCIRCDTCDGYPCLVHAKSDSDVNCIRKIMYLPNVTLMTQAKVTRPLTNPTGTSVDALEAELDNSGKTARVATSKLERLGEVERDLPDNRFNDGKCDPQGRFWAGTMDAVHWSAPTGNLFRMDAERSVTLVQSNAICSNGSGRSPDGRRMYYTESFRYAIFVYDFEPGAGTISNRRPFATLDSNSGGFPDGMTVDGDGFVRSNVVGVGQIHRYDPAGKLERIVQLPVPRATDCTFGGPDLKTLYVTTARETMTPDQLAAAPLSGSLFAIDGPVRGLPSTPFSG